MFSEEGLQKEGFHKTESGGGEAGAIERGNAEPNAVAVCEQRSPAGTILESMTTFTHHA